MACWGGGVWVWVSVATRKEYVTRYYLTEFQIAQINQAGHQIHVALPIKHKGDFTRWLQIG